MDSVQDWTRDYFVKNQESCLLKLKTLSAQDKIALHKNLRQENEKLCMLLGMVMDVQEPEFYCETYTVKCKDGTIRTESGKYREKLNIGDNEIVEDLTPALDERHVVIVAIPASMNDWVKELTPEVVMTETKPHIVKVYGAFDFPVNSMIEVVGFLSTSKELRNGCAMEVTSDSNEQIVDFPENNEQMTTNQSLMHAVVVTEIPHSNPLLVMTSEDVKLSHADVQKDLLKILTQFSLGDEIAAQYILLHLISTVYARVSGEVLGKFSVNLVCSSIPKEILQTYGQMLYTLIELLVPNSVYLPLTIENFNTKAFVPKKDYKTNRLETGLLQLPKHTHLLLDETQLENGKLEAQGCLALQDLSELITSQQLQYDFQFYKIPFHTDIPTMTISEGKSLLPSDFVITIKPDPDSIRLVNETFEAGLHFIKPKLKLFRLFITDCRHSDFSIGEIETKTIETDFVKMRSESNLQVEHLHSLLVVSRLLGISKGEKQFDLSTWEAAKLLETERLARVNSLRSKK